MTPISSLALFLLFSTLHHPCRSFIIDYNSTNFHNMMWSRSHSLNMYHTFLFDLLKGVEVGKFFENLLKNDVNADDENFDEDEFLKNLKHDEEEEGVIGKVASLCGKLRNATSKFVSDDCLKDLDFVACALFDFIGTMKKLVKGECKYSGDAAEEAQCNADLKKNLVDNMWPVHMVDAFGKLPSGLNMGSHMTLGRYSDCKSIVVPRTTHKGRPFEANYCRATFRLPLPETVGAIASQCMVGNAEEPLIDGVNHTCGPSSNLARLKWGICAPKSCNTRNLTVLFRYTVFPTRNFCNVTVVCESDSEYSKDIKFIICMCLLSILAALLISGTAYDLIVYQPISENLPDRKYDLFNGDKQDFEMNGGFSDNILMNNGKTKNEHYKDLNWYYKFIMAFSVYTNASRILDSDENPKEFAVLNAFKTINCVWMITIFANIYALSYIDNTKAVPKFVSGFWYQLVNNGSFVSDTFLLLSGFFLCYWFLKRVHSIRETMSVGFWLKYYAKRLLRIYPPYILLLAIILFAWHYTMRGPMWTVYFFNMNSPLTCEKSLLTNLFFVNNFGKLDTPCLPITQLLTLDMQLHILAPIILISWLKFPRASFILSTVLIVASAVLQVLLANIYDLPPSLMGTADVYSLDKPLIRYYNVLFTKPYTRCNAFLIGIMLAHIVVRKSNWAKYISEKFPKLLWFVAVSTCLACVFGPYKYANGQSIGPFSHGAYVALSRISWSLAVALFIYMCLTDNGGIVQFFFSQPFWAPFGRISYSAYLVAPIIVLYGYVTSSSTIHLTSLVMIYSAIGNTVAVYCAAFIFHLAFEAPFMNFRHLWFYSNNDQYHVNLVTPDREPTKMEPSHKLGAKSKKSGGQAEEGLLSTAETKAVLSKDG